MSQESKFRVSDEKLKHLIESYCRDLTQRVKDGRTEPIIGRENEVDQMTTILLQKGRSNAVLLGPAGVGKTAAFMALARHIVLDDDVPEPLKDARVLEIDFSMVGAGAESKSEFLGRLVPLIEGVAERNDSKKFPPYIFCIDELHNVMMSAMSSAAANNAAAGVGDIMKPYLTTGHLQLVGATTLDEFNMFIKSDPAMERRFQNVLLKEASDEETVEILKGLKGGYEKHFNIEVPDDAIVKIVDLARQFLRNRNNPDKSLVVLDGACARAVKGKQDRISIENIAQTVSAETGVDAKAIG